MLVFLTAFAAQLFLSRIGSDLKTKMVNSTDERVSFNITFSIVY